MSRLLTFSTGPRSKWVVLGVWLLVLAGSIAFDLPGRYTDAEKNESTSFLPSDAESTKALTTSEEIRDGDTADIIVVYRREGGLTEADKDAITDDCRKLEGIRREYRQLAPFFVAPPAAEQGGEQPTDGARPGCDAPVADQRGAALLVGRITGDGEAPTILDPIDDIRETVSGDRDGLEVKVSGPAGFAADAIKVFESINGTLLLAAVTLVFVLLILIYRSPLFFWIPLAAVGFAELATRSIGYGLTELGITVNGQSSSILSVLVLGAGTDYALLLVSRYREELTRHEDKHEAARLAMQNAGPAIVASAATVILALLCLSIAEVEGTAGLGPIGAVGIAVAMISMTTLLPALLAITGRSAFRRPRFLRTGDGIPRVGDAGVDETHGSWRGVGDRVARSPRRVWLGSAAILVVMALGLTQLDTGLTSADAYRDEVESVQGQELLAKSFPAGANAPTEILVPDGSDPRAVAEAVAGIDGVDQARPTPEHGAGYTIVQATLEPDPYSTEAYDLVGPIRDAAKEAGGEAVLVGGPSAVEHDTREAAARDSIKIPPITLIVVLFVLVVLLRALVVPLLLIGTVVLSFAASLGFSILVFDLLFGFPGIDPSLPLYAFVFLVALGVDYNIFLMARAREETSRWGTRHGMVRALAVTGAVITSAGIVLAGTFSVLAVLPLVFLTEIGFTVAFGVLLDTFLVRSVLVPALVLDIGPKVWWPSKLAEAAEHDDRTEDRPAATV